MIENVDLIGTINDLKRDKKLKIESEKKINMLKNRCKREINLSNQIRNNRINIKQLQTDIKIIKHNFENPLDKIKMSQSTDLLSKAEESRNSEIMRNELKNQESLRNSFTSQKVDLGISKFLKNKQRMSEQDFKKNKMISKENHFILPRINSISSLKRKK